jgi:3-polyprenyl-4-hydroxybenzoate decarboxylase and related decarboxylases
LRRITAAVDPDLELAAIADRVLAAGGQRCSLKT